ncbi:MAG TPA: hypothetical protein VFG63_11700 [Nocardioidaceae bacterium]|nr:hypothetical protein [Nocardioidaceae bacterium]
MSPSSTPALVERVPDVAGDLFGLLAPYRGYSMDWVQRLRRGELPSRRPARLASASRILAESN